MVAVHIYFFEIEKRRSTVNDEKTRYKKKNIEKKNKKTKTAMRYRLEYR